MPLAMVSKSASAPAAAVREQRPRAAEAGLDLVDDEQGAVLAAQPRQLAQVVGEGMRTPPSPCTGSTITAATSPSSAAPTASALPYGTNA